MAFTTITKTTSWQSLAIAAELADAYNARVSALTPTEQAYLTQTSIEPSAGQTVIDFIHKLQIGCEELAAAGWANPSAVIGGGSDYLQTLSKDGLFALAGMYLPGYWRAVPVDGALPETWTDYADPAYTHRGIGEPYGYDMYFPGTDPDKGGPWLWRDLHLILSKMTRRVYDPMSVSRCVAGCSGYPTPLDPASPSYTCGNVDYGITCSATKFWDSENTLTQQFVEAGYRELTLSGLPQVSKNVYLSVRAEWPSVYEPSPPYLFHSLLNPSILTPTYNSRLVSVVAAAISSTLPSFTMRDFPVVTTWSDMLDFIQTPNTSSSRHYFCRLLPGAQFIVDYSFEP